MGHASEHEKPLDPGKDRRWQYGMRILTGGMIALFAIFVGIIIYWIARPEPFDPLEFQTAQVRVIAEDGAVIVPQVPGEDAPSIYIDQELPVIFNFCSTARDQFTAVGNSWFVDATHHERYVLNEGLESTVRPGCVAPRLSIKIPAQVRADLLDFASGAGPSGEASPWYIEGELIPTRDGSVTASWRSEIFYIIAEEEP